jgi:hypothetical protein
LRSGGRPDYAAGDRTGFTPNSPDGTRV